ncbi:pfs domain-containing protein [Trichoderma harzianum]|uniref:Pfs domain-containing protein n=1 Tax=Trichoderma harzianum TaxID=5544 RepID=A0A0F9WYZ7_TRIHA|nr:pfs domain-containing protein [Trichoderma harzianum]
MNTSGSRWAKRSWVDDDDEVSFVQAFKRPRIEESSVKLQNESYTIAWICALPIEMAAANAMLDGVHPSLPSNLKDSNSYILGNVGRHNIVVACLPADHYGTNSAAIVANNLIRTFPSIRTGLMVGIGGGVPGSVDVRLGDVVVGYNVVQHDLGKIVQGSRVYRTGTPKSPPSSILAAVSKLRAIHEYRPSRVPGFLQEMIIKHPKMTSLALATCDSCDTSMLVYRPLRMDNHPVIHYGNVASGNQVMKDAISRDEIARELNIICFEMEAAGLSDALPCLVIRGICDYSDSHKNKQWQERIEEIQDIRISSDSSNTRTDRVKTSIARSPKPRPPKPQSPEDDISRYKQVQLVDVDFKIGLSTVDQLVMKAALKLSSGDLSDTEHLAERLALVYGLSEADSLALSQKIDVQHAHIRFLQRQQLDSDTDPNIVPDFDSKGKQKAKVNFGTANLREDEFSSRHLQTGDLTRETYKWTEKEEARMKAQRSKSLNPSRPEPESDTLDIHAIKAPGGFRRDSIRRDITSPSGDDKNDHKGADLTGTDRPPLTSNFVEFLSMYGHFAGEDLEEDDEALGPDDHAQSDITAAPKDIGEEYEQIPGSSKHHSNAQEILNAIDASKQPLTPPDVKGTMSMYDTVYNQEPDISLDIEVPETSTGSGTLSSTMGVHSKSVHTSSPPPDIPSAQVSLNRLFLNTFHKSNRSKIRPVSGDSVLVAYLGSGRHPEIAQAARRQALSSADEDAFESSDSEDNAYYKSPSRDANPIEADKYAQPY